MKNPSARRWVPLLGYSIYIGLLSGGYYYNLTFVQLGLIDLGIRHVGMSPGAVSRSIAALAATALATAVLAGWMMDRRGWSGDLRVKLRILFAVVAAQTALTVIAPSIASPGQFLNWVLVCSVAIGVGMPFTFSLMIDFIPSATGAISPPWWPASPSSSPPCTPWNGGSKNSLR